jgi:hypothetical protein
MGWEGIKTKEQRGEGAPMGDGRRSERRDICAAQCGANNELKTEFV